MLIEITGTGTRNKGAELMLVAIKQQLEQMNPSIQLAADVSFGSYQDRARHGLLQKMEISRPGRSRMALNLMPASFRKVVGIVRDKETNAVLDASGFAFGDQHPVERSLSFAKQAEGWATAGKPLVLLPQALGPFQKNQHRNAFRRIAASASLIFARDPASYEHAVDAAGSDRNIHMAPDFTSLVNLELRTISAESRRACFVPNARMLEHAGSPEQAEKYLSLLANACDLARAAQLEPVLLVHGQEDKPVAEAVGERGTAKRPNGANPRPGGNQALHRREPSADWFALFMHW